jgi:hypothetical protein
MGHPSPVDRGAGAHEEFSQMPKKHPASRGRKKTNKGKPHKSRHRKTAPHKPAPLKGQGQDLYQRHEETICKRIVEEFGFSDTSFSALLDFRLMHSGEVEPD